MIECNFTRSVTSIRLMTELGVDYGMSVCACLAGTGLKEQDLTDPAVVVSAKQELRLIGNLLDRLGDVPGLGIEAGKRYHFTAFGALGFAMVSSQNARSALDIALRYFQLTFAFTNFDVEEKGDETHITLDDSSLPDAIRIFVVERDSSALVTVQRDLFISRPVLQGLYFSFQEPAHSALYEAFYGIRPVFGAASNKAVMNTAAMMEPLPQGNALALAAAEEQCRALLDRHRSRAGLAGKVRDHLARYIAQMPDMGVVSSELCMTPRTLRRRLLDEGTTFLKLRDEVRLALAEEFLTSFALSIERIAEQLGYSEPTCFINAFKRWTGKTPLVYRKESEYFRSAICAQDGKP
jgi:AraC-like DNA-binding protein